MHSNRKLFEQTAQDIIIAGIQEKFTRKIKLISQKLREEIDFQIFKVKIFECHSRRK